MAVYYKHIKGCEAGASLTSGAWSYISWGTGTDITKTDVMPQLRISTGKNDTATSGSLGYFLTSGMPTPTIKNNWFFLKGVSVGGDVTFSNGWSLVANDRNLKLYSNSSDWSVFEVDYLITQQQYTSDEVTVGDVLSISRWVDTNTTKTTRIDPNGITTKGYCEAEFFNARSDKRAKENIKPVDFSALEVVNQTPVYSFNYKGKTENVPGVIAQDLLKLDLPVELVNNINASGENGDYMSIKESKLIYILWKAIQEQQAEIEALKKQINN